LKNYDMLTIRQNLKLLGENVGGTINGASSFARHGIAFSELCLTGTACL